MATLCLNRGESAVPDRRENTPARRSSPAARWASSQVQWAVLVNPAAAPMSPTIAPSHDNGSVRSWERDPSNVATFPLQSSVSSSSSNSSMTTISSNSSQSGDLQAVSRRSQGIGRGRPLPSRESHIWHQLYSAAQRELRPPSRYNTWHHFRTPLCHDSRSTRQSGLFSQPLCRARVAAGQPAVRSDSPSPRPAAGPATYSSSRTSNRSPIGSRSHVPDTEKLRPTNPAA